MCTLDLTCQIKNLKKIHVSFVLVAFTSRALAKEVDSTISEWAKLV